MKKYIKHGNNRYDTSKITFVAYKKLFPTKSEKDFKEATGREAKKPVKKVVKKIAEKPVEKNAEK